MNISHWIGYFSTVGLDSHLGFRQKRLREENHLLFHIFGEGETELREKGTNSKTELEEIFSGHKNQGDNCWHEFRGEVRPAFIVHRNRGEGTASFIAGMFFEELYGASNADRTVRFLHDFRGQFGHKIRGRTAALIAVRTVRILSGLAQFSRAGIC